MFDIGFPELILVSIVALLVIGPERLPETIRTIMLWLGRIRRSFTNIKAELEQEIGADEIRRQLHNETIMKDLRESKEKIEGALKEADQSIDEFKHSVHGSIAGLQESGGKTEPSGTEASKTHTSETHTGETSPHETPTSDPATDLKPQSADKQTDEPERRSH